jgi:GINS complex subunit 4
MYLLREYMRTRLRKIETYALHLYTTPDAAEALGPAEKKYLEAYVGAVSEHMQSALEVLPEGYQKLLKEYDAGEEEEAEWMKPKPDLDSLVFFRFRQDVNNYLAPGDDEPVDIARGNIVMAKYSMFKPLTEMDPPMAELT